MSEELAEMEEGVREEGGAKVPTRYPIAVVGLMVLCAAVAWGSAAWWWLSPTAAVLVYLMMVVPTAGFTTLLALFLDPTKTRTVRAKEAEGAPVLQERLRLAWWPLVVAGVLGFAVVVSWAAAPVRQAAAARIGAQRHVGPLRRCLSDAAPGVVVACCEATRGWADGALQDDYAVWMLNNPEHHNACMVEATSPRPSSLIIERLAESWTRELMREQPSMSQAQADRLCQRAAFLRHADRVERVGASLALTRCALSAPEHAARQCCEAEVRQLVGASPSLASALPAPERALGGTRDGLLIQLLSAASPGADGETQTRATALKIDTPELRAWALQTSCAALSSPSGHDLAQVRARMLLLLHASGCEGLPGHAKLTDMACAERLQDERAVWTPAALCADLRAVHLGAAISEARFGVRRASHHAQTSPRSGSREESDGELVNRIITSKGTGTGGQNALVMLRERLNIPSSVGSLDDLNRQKVYGRSMKQQGEVVRDIVINQGVQDPVKIGELLRERSRQPDARRP